MNRRDVLQRTCARWPHLKKMAPITGPFSLVVPMMVTLDDYRSVAIMIVPAAMRPAIMFVKFGTRAAIVTVAIVISVASDPEAKTLSACHCRRRNRDDR